MSKEQITNNGFRLLYEDFDRYGTAGASTTLKATNIDEAVGEVRDFLTRQSRLPAQARVTVVQSFAIDVSDMNLGK